MQIIDFSNCEFNNRHGRYGGAAGDKDGILYNGENWIIKYPKSTRSMQGEEKPSYTTSPLSEYVGSHVYQILGYDVHETLLGIRNNRVVVACKDFQTHMGDLAEIRTLKNAANRELQRLTDDELPESVTGDRVSLDELLLHFEHNPLLKAEKIQERFWDCVVIDILIDNNDRNNGNWGILYHEDGSRTIAPIFDNGNAFSNKTTVESIARYLSEPEHELENRMTGLRTIYEYKGHVLSAKKMMQLDNDDLRQAILRVTPKVLENMEQIKTMIQEIPEKSNGYEICPAVVKEYYTKGFETRINKLLLPAYRELEKTPDKSLEADIASALKQYQENRMEVCDNQNTQRTDRSR